MGGAVAIDLAGEKNVGGLITEDVFTSVRDMARVVYPFIPGFLISDRFDSIPKIAEITCPKLIMHSVNDEIVPFKQGQALFRAAGPPKTFIELKGSHNTAFVDSESQFIEGIKAFLQSLPYASRSSDTETDLDRIGQI